MRAGLLRHKVIIQQATETQASDGSVSQSWGTFATIWAQLRPERADEQFEGERFQARVYHRIFIRYLSGVIPKMRILYGSRVFEIQGIMNYQERNAMMELLAYELV